VIADQLEGLLEDAARHLSGRDAGTSSLLSLPTTLDTIGEIRQRIAVCDSFGSNVDGEPTEREVALECLIRVVHLGGAEFYRASRSAELFATLLEETR
jgi:hypothetical protein